LNLEWIAGFVDGEGCFTVNILHTERFGVSVFSRVTGLT